MRDPGGTWLWRDTEGLEGELASMAASHGAKFSTWTGEGVTNIVMRRKEVIGGLYS